jgi:histidine triad (HIT) family protein
MEDCVFCKIVNGEISTKKTYEDDNFIGFLDAHPKADGHSLIVPKKHFKSILDMPSSLGEEMLDTVKEVALGLVKIGNAEGFNIVVNSGESAGQVVHHFHIHIIPRKNGDGLRMLV